jgi:DNA repair exonuclease SbcCD nuclease subunit
VQAPLREFPHQRGDLNLAVFHGTLVPPSVRPGDPFGSGRSLPIDQRALESAGFDYVALGHIHVPAEHRLGVEALAVYPGCVGGKGPRDVGSDSWTLVELNPGRIKVERRPATFAPVWSRDVDVTPHNDATTLVEAIRAQLTPHSWARVRLTGSLAFSLNLEGLSEELRPAARHLEVVDATSSVAPELLERWAAQPTVRGAFVRRLLARQETAPDEATRALVQRALRIGLAALSESS